MMYYVKKTIFLNTLKQQWTFKGQFEYTLLRAMPSSSACDTSSAILISVCMYSRPLRLESQAERMPSAGNNFHLFRIFT